MNKINMWEFMITYITMLLFVGLAYAFRMTADAIIIGILLTILALITTPIIND